MQREPPHPGGKPGPGAPASPHKVPPLHSSPGSQGFDSPGQHAAPFGRCSVAWTGSHASVALPSGAPTMSHSLPASQFCATRLHAPVMSVHIPCFTSPASDGFASPL